MSETDIEHFVGQDEHTFMVMLVDLQLVIAEQMRKDLLIDSRIGFYHYSDLHNALSVAESACPSVIFLDLLMPDIDGVSAIQMFRKNNFTKEIPIVALSSKEDVGMRAKAFEDGANDYLIKMPDKLELVARVVYHSLACIYKKQRDEAFRALSESQRKIKEKNIQSTQQSTIDEITCINNRHHFDELLAKLWVNAQRTNTMVAVIMIDVDYFKLFSDKYGHVDGNDCLKVVAQVLSEDIPRATDFIARYSDEKFAVVLFATDIDGAAIVAERLRKNVAELQIPNEDSPVSDYISISAGVASMIPASDVNQKQLIEVADAALCKAIEMGRSQVVTTEALGLE